MASALASPSGRYVMVVSKAGRIDVRDTVTNNVICVAGPFSNCLDPVKCARPTSCLPAWPSMRAGMQA
jgi:hypothetical protein